VVDSNGSLVLVHGTFGYEVVDTSGVRPTVSDLDGDVFSASRREQFWVSEGHSVRAVYGNQSFWLPRGLQAVADAGRTFVVRNRRDGDSLEVWAPATGERWRLPGGASRVVAVHGSTVAWTGADCSGSQCFVHFTNVERRTDTAVALPRSTLARSSVGPRLAGRFSPDGTHLAVFAGDRNGVTSSVVLVDVRAATTRALASLVGQPASFGPGAPFVLPFDWSPDGATLVAVEPGDRGRRSRLTLIDVATGRARVSGDALPFTRSLVTYGIAPSPVRLPFERSSATAWYVASTNDSLRGSPVRSKRRSFIT
jgi:hypothetical protein